MAQTTATVYICEPFEARVGDPYIASFLVVFSYRVGGEYFSGEFLSPDELEKDQTFTLSYDSDHPERNEHTAEQEEEDDASNLMYKIVVGIVVVCAVAYGVVYFFIK